jgi:hypothetical protein
MITAHVKNRTNVRFSIVLISAWIAGCASQSAPITDQRCPAETFLICERFASEQRCECAAQHEVLTLLPGASAFGRP